MLSALQDVALVQGGNEIKLSRNLGRLADFDASLHQLIAQPIPFYRANLLSHIGQVTLQPTSTPARPSTLCLT